MMKTILQIINLKIINNKIYMIVNPKILLFLFNHNQVSKTIQIFYLINSLKYIQLQLTYYIKPKTNPNKTNKTNKANKANKANHNMKLYLTLNS